MNRAFVKEPDPDQPPELPERPISPHANYVTPRGLALLRHAREDAAARLTEIKSRPETLHRKTDIAAIERDLRWLDARNASAQVVEPRKDGEHVAFGTKVEVISNNDATHVYRIVGEDEADAEQGLVSYVSPLAKALSGAQVGDEVVWKRPAGDLVIEVLSINGAD